MTRPDFRIMCALCRKPIPKTRDVLALDAEWQRRYPNLVGCLACECALSRPWFWTCRLAYGRYEPEHIPAASRVSCVDAMSHIPSRGTHKGLVQRYPAAGMVQGAADYLRAVATHPKAEQLRVFLAEWDATH